MSYGYTYPPDIRFIDRATVPGPIRQAAHRLFQECRENGDDMWDLIEDDPDLTDEQKTEVHRVFGGPDETNGVIAEKRARGVRYGR